MASSESTLNNCQLLYCIYQFQMALSRPRISGSIEFIKERLHNLEIQILFDLLSIEYLNSAGKSIPPQSGKQFYETVVVIYYAYD